MKFFKTIFVILLLIFSVNGKAKTFNHTTILNTILEDIIKIAIDKNTSDKEIGKIMKNLDKQGVKAEFTDIRRNDANEIIAISIAITKNGSTSSYSASSNTAIAKIIIDIEGDFISIHSDGLQIFGFGNQDELAKMMQERMAVFNDRLSAIDMDEFENNMKEQMEAFKNQFDNIDELKNRMERQKKLFSSFFPKFQDKFANEDEPNKQLPFLNNNATGLQNLEEYDYHQESKSTYIVNGKEMSKEAYEKVDKATIKSLQIKKEVLKSYKK